jgi:hypothetical protein
MMHRWAPAAVLCAGVMLLAPLVGAQARDQRTLLTFDQAVEIPGNTLEPGTYEFRLADSRADRHIVQVWNEQGTELIATLMAVPERRLEASGEALVSLATGEAGTKPALRAWFYPGERTGHRFVYPEEQARRIAERTQEEVLAAEAESLRPDRIDTARFEIVNERGEGARYDGAGAEMAPLGSERPVLTDDSATIDRRPAERGAALETGEAQQDQQQDQRAGQDRPGLEDQRVLQEQPAPHDHVARMEQQRRYANLGDDRTWHSDPADTPDRQDLREADRAAVPADPGMADQQADLVTEPRRGQFVGTERDDLTDRDEIFRDDDVTEQFELTRAQEHIQRITQLTDRLLVVSSAPAGERQHAERRTEDDRGVVGTTGAVGTSGGAAGDGERVTLSREQLEELRAHALQAQAALRALAGQGQAQPSVAAPQQPQR